MRAHYLTLPKNFDRQQKKENRLSETVLVASA